MITPRPEFMIVTPRIAQAWLTKNSNNRNLRPRKVDAYAAAMRAGDWIASGDSIKFDPDGNLLDGQHRLAAVVASGVSITVLVVWDVSPEAQAVVDTGARRTSGDTLKLSGYANWNMLAACARIALDWDEGLYRRSGQVKVRREVTNREILNWVEKNDDAHGAVTEATRLRKAIPVPPSVIAFVFMTLARIDATEAHDFFDDIENMQTRGKGDPLHTLLRRYGWATKARERLDVAQHLFLLFRTWNARRSHEVLHNLRIGNTGTGGGKPRPIAIPVPK